MEVKIGLLQLLSVILKLFGYSSYIDQLARDVNDHLQELGQITFARLTKEYDLPGDFLKKVCIALF